MLALPRSLSRDQQAELVRDFVQRVSENRVGWIAAIHRDGEDAQNPHAHLIIRDRDFQSGKRVIGTSECRKGRKAGADTIGTSTELFRVEWEKAANSALRRAGHEERISHKSHAARGLETLPQVHLGQTAARMEAQGIRTRLGDRNRQIAKWNLEVTNYLRALSDEVAAARKAVMKIFARSKGTPVEKGVPKPTLVEQVKSTLDERDALKERFIRLTAAESARFHAIERDLKEFTARLERRHLAGTISLEHSACLALIQGRKLTL